MRKHWKRIFQIMLIAVILMGIFPFGWRWMVQWRYGRFITPIEQAPQSPVAIVFGAAVYENGRLSDVLRDRMDVAIQLYKQGNVKKLIVSGDNRFVNYDEPTAMKQYAIEHGIPAADIQPDFAGRRTYDTCYRAKHIFQVDEAILVTQQFHLPRALFTCQQLGLSSTGVAADLQPYLDARWFAIREAVATSKALWDVIEHDPAPVMGDPIPIFSN
ncbi:MAG: hypothetical protein DWQ04_08355 [Chloroflexi bacterium]|nr:MAG: hypothetical protein DWQ04_08355 [Chloroflexota bacterium]